MNSRIGKITGEHELLDRSSFDEGCVNFADNPTLLLVQREERNFNVVMGTGIMTSVMKRTQLESIRKKVLGVDEQLATKESTIKRRTLKPRQSQEIDLDVVEDYERELAEKVASVRFIRLKIEEIVKKVDEVLSTVSLETV